MRTLVNAVVSEQLAVFLEENPAVGKAILDKAMTASRAREAARKAREAIRRKTGLESGQMPDKLRDCNDTDPALTEIYIVEGDSAGGSARSMATTSSRRSSRRSAPESATNSTSRSSAITRSSSWPMRMSTAPISGRCC